MLNNFFSLMMAASVGAGVLTLIKERDFTTSFFTFVVLAIVFTCLSEWKIAKDRSDAEKRRIRALENQDSEWNKLVDQLLKAGFLTTDDVRTLRKFHNDGSETEVTLVDEQSPATKADGKYWGPRA